MRPPRVVVRGVYGKYPAQVPLTEDQHLRRVLAIYAAHYNTGRPHRALQLRPPRPQAFIPDPAYSRIRRRPVLGGLINQYELAA